MRISTRPGPQIVVKRTLPDDFAEEWHAPVAKDSAGVHQVPESLLLDKPSDRQQERNTRLFSGGPGTKTIQVDPVVNPDNPSRRKARPRQIGQVAAVEFTDRDHPFRLEHEGA